MIKGERIKELRKKLNLTQSQLAELAGTTQQTIYAMEKNKIKTIKTPRLEQLSDALNTSTDYLLGRTDIENMELYNIVDQSSGMVAEIPVYGNIPAGKPIEALEIDYGYIPVTTDMLRGDKQLIGLKVVGDSMYPKYMEDDIILIEITTDVQSGDDVVAFIGYDTEATLKRFHWRGDDAVELEPLNREYPVKVYTRNDPPVRILGKVVEIRRAV